MQGNGKDTISIIIPCHNEQVSLPILFDALAQVAASMPDQVFEYIFVDDGSQYSTWSILCAFADKDPRARCLSLSRNFGKESAIFAGLEHATGDYVTIMDADMQDPPKLIPEMYRIIKEESCDSVATRRSNRKGESPIRSFFAHSFYRMMNRMSEVELVDGARDFRLMNRKFTDAILSLGEYNRFSKGLFSWVGFKTHWIDYPNTERVAGTSQWSFRSLLRYGIGGVVSFSTSPLLISSVLGLGLCLFAFCAIIFIIVRWLAFGDPVSGWPSLACIIIFIGGVQLFFLGVFGQYLANMYLETKRRPIYLLAEEYSSKQAANHD